MRFHVVSLPHTVTSKEFNACAYTQKVLNFCKMMRDLGHTVYHYGADESKVEADENVPVTTRRIQEQCFGTDWRVKGFNLDWNPDLPYWCSFNGAVIHAMRRRIQARDFICLIGGNCQKAIADAFPGHMSVEFGVGYYGVFSKYRVFESHSHMSCVYGMLSRPNGPDVNLYDIVIPNYYDVGDFPDAVYPTEDYLLFIGRLIARKGLQIAIDTARAVNIQLVIAGQGLSHEDDQAWYSDEGIKMPKDICKYVGYADVETRGKLMAQARAVMVPTTYLEPFGGVSVEAQMCGTPVITTNFGAFAENVLHGLTGYRCHTLGQFVQAVDRVENLRLTRSEIQTHARKTWGLGRIRNMYQEYFLMLDSLWRQGWPEISLRDQLSWLKI